MPNHDQVPELRVRALNQRPLREDASYVVYWMIASRRLEWNFALQRAIEHARALKVPLVLLEALRCGYPWASDRLHSFVLDGMAGHARRLAGSQVLYHPYVEPEKGAGSGLLEALAERAAVVVTDDYPAFFLPRMLRAAAERLPVRLEAVDSNGLLPMRAADKIYSRAVDFRRFLQRELPQHLDAFPRQYPLVGQRLATLEALPAEILARWPAADEQMLAASPERLAALPLDHSVSPAPDRGGAEAARAKLDRFLEHRLDRYGEGRNHPDEDASSELSPYLHFGHLSAHQIFVEVMQGEGWNPSLLSESARGGRSGWWGTSAPVEAFLDQLITWRELGLNRCSKSEDYDQFDSLPAWAIATLEEHAGDERPQLYTLEQFEMAETHDEIWNAAQRQLVGEGRIHNYLRMLWGKKILHWTESPRQALAVMIELNDKYALDGRDPNSYSGIFWVLGRYDRAWGPEREVFGKIRYMTSKSTRSKLKLKGYLERWGPNATAD